MGVNDTAQLFRIQQKVAFYENCFRVCLTAMILFCCLAIFLCIYFRIPSILAERLGIKRRRTLSQMGQAASVKLSSCYPQETASEKTVLLTDDSFVMEKDIVMSEVRNRQKKREG